MTYNDANKKATVGTLGTLAQFLTECKIEA